MKKLSFMNVGKNSEGIKILKVTVDDNDSMNIPVPVLEKIINSECGECNEGSFYNAEDKE